MSLRTAVVVDLVIFGAGAIPGFAQSAFVNWESPHVHPLDLTPDGTRLLAVNTPDNRLEVFDVSSGTPDLLQSIPVGLDPVSVRARSNNEAWVINQISDSVSIVDLPSGRVVRTITTGDEPADVVFAGSPERAFVSISQLNQLRVYDPANPGVAPVIVPIQGEDPRALAVNAGGTMVFAAIFESGNRTTIVGQATVSAPAGPYGGTNPPPNNGNQFFPPRTVGQPPPPPVGQIVRRNAAGDWLDDNDRNWSAQVTWGLHDQDVAIIEATTLSVGYATGLMTTVAQLAVAPSGLVTAVGTEALNEIRFEPNVNGVFVRAQLATFEPAAPALVTSADLNPHLSYTAPSVPQATRILSIGDPRAIVWHPSGDRAFVAGMGSNNVVVMDSAGARLGLIEVGEGPTGLAVNASGDRLYVLNKFEGAISVVDTGLNTELARISFFDPTPLAIKLGRPFLYDTHRTSGLGQASCAGCHIDARTDHLGWDLGNPAGEVKEVNFTCRQGDGECADWHPMKGPMVTQTLLGIVGTEPFHWRGDREDVAAFAPAFTGLQGADAEPTPEELQRFTDFIATLRFPPNPNRNLDGTLRTTLPTSTGNGNAQNGLNLYLNAPILGGVLRCVACHALPTGNRGFGFNHDGEDDTLFNLMFGGFQFPPGPPGAQQRRDLEAYLLSLSTDTHAAVGQQVTFDGANNNNPQLLTRFNSFVTLADGGQIGLVAKGRQQELDRGYIYVGAGIFQSDRLAETVPSDTLRAAAAPGSELTFTAVAAGMQERVGVDRDEDGHFDRDELDGCSDPADAQSVPPVYGDIAPPGGDGVVNLDDILCVLDGFENMGDCQSGDILPCGGNALIDIDDILAVLDAFSGESACPGACQ